MYTYQKKRGKWLGEMEESSINYHNNKSIRNHNSGNNNRDNKDNKNNHSKNKEVGWKLIQMLIELKE